MAIINKDFRLKNGLIVEGTNATVNGYDILTKTAGDQYILDLVGGVAYITSVSGNLDVADGELSIDTEGLFDTLVSDGLATQTYVTDAIGDIDLSYTTDDVTEGSNLYYTDARVDSHLSGGDGINYSAGTISADIATAQGLGTELGQLIIDRSTVDSWYDANGAASTAESNANSYTDTELADYTLTSDLDTTVGGYGYLKSADLGDYATESYVGTAIDNLVDGAPGLLDTLNEIAAAIADDENYATTMTTALAGKQDELTAGNGIAIDGTTIGVAFDAGNGLAINGTNLTVDQNVIASKSYVDGLASNYDAAGAADTAEDNANSYTDTQLQSYTPTSSLETTIDGYGFAYTSDIPSSTDALTEGTLNRYYTDGRATAAALALLTTAETHNITFQQSGVDGLIVTAENGVADSTTTDLAEGDNLYFTDQRVLDAVNNSTITPAAVEINNYRKEEATQLSVSSASTVNVHGFDYPYESAKYLVRVVGWDGGVKHSQITEILMTVDGNDNIAITEYGNVHTSTAPLASFSATIDSGNSTGPYVLTATTAVGGCEIIAAATMLSWND